MSRKLWIFVVAIGLALGMGRSAFAQDPSAEDLKARLDQQEKQIQAQWDIIQRLQAVPTSPMTGGPQAGVTMNLPGVGGPLGVDDVSKRIDDALNQKEQKKNSEEAAAKKKADDEGYKIGSSLGMTAAWKDYGVFIQTAHKDFWLHPGAQMQWDNVWWTQNRNFIAGGKNPVGDLEDGEFFRRIRIQLDGGFYEIYEFNLIYLLENSQKGLPNLDEFWVGIKDVPWVNTLRFGHFHLPQGLEGDMISSSKAMTFLERAAYTDAFYQNQGSGVWQSNAFMDQRITEQMMVYRSDLGNATGDFFGDGEYGYMARMTALPYYENDGRCLVHLGGSANWRHAQRGGNETADPQFVRFRARPEQRDAGGDLDGTVHDGVINPGNSNRLVDTGVIQGDAAAIFGSEFLWIQGPLSVQAEYAWTFVSGAVIGGKHVDDLEFDGGYVQVSYLLTGENRTYDKRIGRLGSTYITPPNTPFWFVHDECGGYNWGIGAWEIAARYSHLDLNGGPKGQVKGGIMDGVTLGVNWFLTTNLKFQFEWVHDERFHMAPGVIPGNVDGFGIRTQLFF